MKPCRTILFLLLLTFLVSACQVLEQRWEADDAPETDVVEDTEIPTDAPGRLPRAIAHLQDGEVESAERLLAGIVGEDPDNRLAGHLLRQLHEEPEVLLGEDYIQVVVEPGDTLSELAERHAGDGMLFVALARLNAIERPRLLRPGTVLQVPVSDERPEGDGDSLVSAAESLLAEGRSDRALSLLMSAAHADELDEQGRSVLVRSAVAVSGQHLSEGRIDQAEATLEKLKPWAESLSDHAKVSQQRSRVDAHLALQKAEQAAAAGDPETEREWLVQALKLDPDLTVAGSALEAVTPTVVEHYHERALKAWRGQEVSEAVSYWERVLEFDPDFEPARVYLERAREVQRRLEEL